MWSVPRSSPEFFVELLKRRAVVKWLAQMLHASLCWQAALTRDLDPDRFGVIMWPTLEMQIASLARVPANVRRWFSVLVIFQW